MFVKVREIILTKRKFQKASIVLDHQGNTFAVLGFINNSQSKYDDQQIDTFSYDTFIQKNDKLLTISEANLFDVQPLSSNEECTGNWKTCQNTIFLFQTKARLFQSFMQQNRDEFHDKWVNIIEDQSYEAKLLSPGLILKVSQNMKKLSTENLKWNEQNCNITDTKPKKQSKFMIKKQIRNDCIFDVEETPYQHSLITSICPLNQSQALLHLGHTQYGNRNNVSLLNYDIDYCQTNWKHTTSKYEAMINTILLLRNKKVFLNGCYNFDDHISSLKLFDLRVSGVVSNLIQSNSNDLLQLEWSQSGGSILSPNFQYLSHPSEFQVVSILSYKGGAKSFPYTIDTRRPQKILLIKLQNHFSHLRGLQVPNNERLITIERQYHNAVFKNAQLKQYRLGS